MEMYAKPQKPMNAWINGHRLKTCAWLRKKGLLPTAYLVVNIEEWDSAEVSAGPKGEKEKGFLRETLTPSPRRVMRCVAGVSEANSNPEPPCGV